jgi:hypothetical protein
MSGHHARPGPRPRHTPHPAIRATATAIILLAVGACTSTATSASPLATASTGSGGHTGTLTGARSTFVAPFFAVAFARYQQQHPAVTIRYSAVGSRSVRTESDRRVRSVASAPGEAVGLVFALIPSGCPQGRVARGTSHPLVSPWHCSHSVLRVHPLKVRSSIVLPEPVGPSFQ